MATNLNFFCKDHIGSPAEKHVIRVAVSTELTTKIIIIIYRERINMATRRYGISLQVLS